MSGLFPTPTPEQQAEIQRQMDQDAQENNPRALIERFKQKHGFSRKERRTKAK